MNIANYQVTKLPFTKVLMEFPCLPTGSMLSAYLPAVCQWSLRLPAVCRQWPEYSLIYIWYELQDHDLYRIGTRFANICDTKATGPMGPHGAPCYVPIKAEIGWVSVCSPQDKSPSTARRLFRRSSSECEKWRPIITSYGFLWFHIWIYYMDICIYIYGYGYG